MDDIVRAPSADARQSWAERRLTVLYETARALAASASMADGVPRMLEAVCQALGWEYGALWDVDHRRATCCAASARGRPVAQLRGVRRGQPHVQFAPGVGLPGRVWASGPPAWIPDVLEDANFPRAAMAARVGLRAAFGFPLVIGGDVLGVMEFFSRDIRPAGRGAARNCLAPIGSQIGLFIERSGRRRTSSTVSSRCRSTCSASPTSTASSSA